MRYLQTKSVFEHYLKRFNESNTDDIIENVKDILLPISDMGYEISVFQGPLSTKDDESQLIIRDICLKIVIVL